MTVWSKHGGYKIEEMSLTDMHTVIDALEFHRTACVAVPTYGAAEEVHDINRVLESIGHSGITELSGRVPIDITENAQQGRNGGVWNRR